jgi:lipoprotein-releasing system permease protein
MNTLSLFLAWRYLSYKNKDKNVSFMIKICLLGIFIGTFALMLTLIIFNGFEKTIHEKMQGITAQFIISSPGNKLNYQEIRQELLKNFPKDIKALSGNSLRQIIIEKDNLQTVLCLKGVDAINEPYVSTIGQKIIDPAPAQALNSNRLFAQLLTENNIIIGYKTANEYDFHTGDNIEILIPEPGSKKKIFLHKKNVVISGIFKVGLEEYDNNLAFSSIEFLHKLFDEKGVDNVTLTLEPDNPRAITIYKIFLNSPLTLNFWKQCALYIYQKIYSLWDNNIHEKQMRKVLSRALPHLSVETWQDRYPALVSSLRLEKYVMFFILALIILVASMNMVSLLFMQIQQKQRDIAICKTIGMSDNNIQRVFLLLGLTITFISSLCGLACAALAGYFLEKYPFIKLPDVYYVTHLPARMSPDIFIVVFISIMLIGFLATWIPARRCKYIQIAQVLRQE